MTSATVIAPTLNHAHRAGFATPHIAAYPPAPYSAPAASAHRPYTETRPAATNRSIASTSRNASALNALVGIGCFTQGAS